MGPRFVKHIAPEGHLDSGLPGQHQRQVKNAGGLPMKASKDCSALCLTPALVRPRVVPAWHTATGDNMGRTAASAEKKEFARQFASVVVVPTGWLNDMVARSGCAEYCQTQGTGRTSSARRARPRGARPHCGAR